METVQALMGGLFNASLVIMIVATMFNAGLTTTTKALGAVQASAPDELKLAVADAYLEGGKAIENNGGVDFWGNPVPAGATSFGAGTE